MATGANPLGSEFLVNTVITGAQKASSIMSLADGGFLVTWQSLGQDGSSWGIYAQRYDINGAPSGSEFLVNTTTNGTQEEPEATGLANGGFVVTWQTNGQDGSGKGIHAQRFDAAGNPAGVEFLVNTHTIGGQERPSVSALDGGGFVIVWQSYGQDGSSYGVYGQRYDANGVAVSRAFLVNTVVSDNQSDARVASLDGGGFVVTWMSFGQDGDGYGIHGQRYDVSGLATGGEFLINTETASYQVEPLVTGLSGGGFVVTWSSWLQDHGLSSGAYAQMFDANGAAIGGEFLVNNVVIGKQDASSIAALNDGGFVVLWHSDGQDGSVMGVFGQRYDAAGGTVGGAFQVNTTTAGDQDFATVAVLEDGSFVVSWTSGASQDGDSEGIYAQRFEAQLYGTSGADTLVDEGGANWMFGRGGDDILSGNGGNDLVYGGNGGDLLYGNAGTDKLFGGNGRDTLNGGVDDDRLKGQGGNDTLRGGMGADRLTGGAGKDTLIGGADADRFIYYAASDSTNNNRADIIKDFELGVDHIDLTALNLTFIGTASFSGTGAEVRLGGNGVDTFMRADVDGNGSADMKIVIEGVIGLTAGDFIL